MSVAFLSHSLIRCCGKWKKRLFCLLRKGMTGTSRYQLMLRRGCHVSNKPAFLALACAYSLADDAVDDAHALHVVLVALGNLVAHDVWHVKPSIRLADDVELLALHHLESVVEAVEEASEGDGNVVLIVRAGLGGARETRAFL